MKNAVIMTRAHAMARAMREEFPEIDYRATLAEALRIAWKEYHDSASAEWDAMSDNEKYDALQRMASFARKRDSGETSRSGEYRPNRFEWVRDADDMLAIAHEAFIRVTEFLADDDGETPLGKYLYRAVITAAQYIKRQELRNARALRSADITLPDGSAGSVEYIIDNAAPTADRPDDPHTAACIRELLDSLAADQTDRTIIAMKTYGYTQREIAETLGISQPAVAKRIAKMNERRIANA